MVEDRRATSRGLLDISSPISPPVRKIQIIYPTWRGLSGLKTISFLLIYLPVYIFNECLNYFYIVNYLPIYHLL